jgi:hypothetical protein
MKQTAVEWLVSVILDESFQEFYAEEIAQAKEMEKEQIADAYSQGMEDANLFFDISEYRGRDYYNETFYTDEVDKKQAKMREALTWCLDNNKCASSTIEFVAREVNCTQEEVWIFLTSKTNNNE